MNNFKIYVHKSAISEVKARYKKTGRKDFTDHYIWIINVICWQQTIDKRYTRDSFVPVNYDKCESIVSRQELDTMLSNLKSWGIIETDNQYIVGMKSKGYRVVESHRDALKEYKITDKLMNKKIQQHRELMESDTIKIGLGDLWRSLHSVRIDEKRAIKFIRNKYNVGSDEYGQRFVSIKSIAAGQFYMHRDAQGRVHTNITSLGGDLRQFLYNETGEVFREVDIANSQPLFFYCAMSKADTIDPKELEDYRNLVVSGEFYNTLNTIGMDYDAFKKLFYVDVLFGQNKSWTGKIAKVFSERWPSIYAFVRKQKEKDHNRLALMLQKEESNFVINICTAEFLRRTGYEFVVTVHDSLLVLDSQVAEGESVLEDMFKKYYGFVPKIKIK